VKDNIVVGQRKMGEGRQCDTAFQHAAHHAGYIILFADSIDLRGFEDASRLGEFDIDIVAAPAAMSRRASWWEKTLSSAMILMGTSLRNSGSR